MHVWKYNQNVFNYQARQYQDQQRNPNLTLELLVLLYQMSVMAFIHAMKQPANVISPGGSS